MSASVLAKTRIGSRVTGSNSEGNFNRKFSTAIVGAHGYTGRELARLLLSHPQMQLKACFSRDSQWQLANDLPDAGATEVPTLNIENLKSEITNFQSVFLATPSEVSMEICKELSSSGTQIIDLSGAFRLEPGTFEKWYGMKHQIPELVNKAEFGLMPWNTYDTPPALISNPGCFATSILMALLPLLKSGLIQTDSLVIDSKSGTSGAGLKAKENLLFNEVEGDCLPYRVGKHQHLPEIREYLKFFSGVEVDPHFSTSLLPVRRGIISSIYARLNSQLTNLSGEQVLDQLDSAFERAYRHYPLVKYGRLGQSEHQDRAYLSLRRVVGTCRTHISYTIQGEKLYIFSAIDNLLKGAASQAIENWNVSQGFPVETGLTNCEGPL